MALLEDGSRFALPWVSLCEGRGDQRFFARLLESHEFDDNFDIRVPIIDGSYQGGRTNFGRYLSSISVDESFLTNVTAVLIVSDNDDASAFGEVQAQLRKATGYGIPDGELQVAKSVGFPSVVILMIPMGGVGNLEMLCLRAAYEKWKLELPLDAFVAECPAKSWDAGKQAKMRIQTILAATNDSQPDTGFAGHWFQPEKYRIPLTCDCFTDLVEFLTTTFPELVGP
jgi:hypothetical protein